MSTVGVLVPFLQVGEMRTLIRRFYSLSLICKIPKRTKTSWTSIRLQGLPRCLRPNSDRQKQEARGSPDILLAGLGMFPFDEASGEGSKVRLPIVDSTKTSGVSLARLITGLNPE